MASVMESLTEWFDHKGIDHLSDLQRGFLYATFSDSDGDLNLVIQQINANTAQLEIIGLETVTASEELMLSEIAGPLSRIRLAHYHANDELRALLILKIDNEETADSIISQAIGLLLNHAILARLAVRSIRDGVPPKEVIEIVGSMVESAIKDTTYEVDETQQELIMSLPPEALNLLLERAEDHRATFFQENLARFTDSILTAYTALLNQLTGPLAMDLWNVVDTIWSLRQEHELESLPLDVQHLVQDLEELQGHEDLASAYRALEISREVLRRIDRRSTPVLLSGLQVAQGSAHQAIFRRTIDPNEAALADQAYRGALQIIKRDVAPAPWSQLQGNLGTLFLSRYDLIGEEYYADEAEKAFRMALEVHTREVAPLYWAQTQSNLGAALMLRYERTGEERYADGAEGSFRLVLQTLTQELADSTSFSASVYHNLGTLFLHRYTRTGEEHYADEAVKAFRTALDVRTPESAPWERAQTQCNLGATLVKRFERTLQELYGDAGEEALRKAMNVFTREDSPSEWAYTQLNLSVLLSARYQLTKVESYADEAEQALRGALEVHRRQGAPSYWGRDQGNLGVLLSARYRLTKVESYADEAEQALRGALDANDPLVEPAYALMWQHYIAQLLVSRKRWAEADAAYTDTIQTAELQYLAAPSDAERRLLMKEHVVLYQEHAFCLLGMGEPARAFVRLDEGRARGLGEILGLEQAARAAHGEEGVARLRSLRRTLRANEQVLDEVTKQLLVSASTLAYTIASDQRDKAAAGVRAAYDELRAEVQALGLKPSVLNLADLLKLRLSSKIAVVALLPGSDTHALIMHENSVLPVALPSFEQVYVESLIYATPPPARNWFDAHISRVDAQLALQATEDGKEDSVLKKATVAQANQAWLKAVDEIAATQGDYDASWYTGYRLAFGILEHGGNPSAAQAAMQAWKGIVAKTVGILRERFWKPVKAALPKEVEKVLLLVGGEAALLPLHVAADELTVGYAPSLSVWLRCKHSTVGRTPNSLLLATPASPDDLVFTTTEAEWLTHIFDEIGGSGSFLEPRQLDQEAATIAGLVRASAGMGIIHFSGHGNFNWGQPLQSGLLCYDGILTLAQIRQEMDLRAARLVVLSACSTGMSDVFGSGEEWVGLPAGLLEAGAPAVVASLWPVNDLSTAFLMDRFYTLWLEQGAGRTVSGALREATEWLRNASWADLGERVATSELSEELHLLLSKLLEQMQMASTTKMSHSAAGDFIIEMARANPDEKPFASPYYWAAFAAYGAVF